MADIVQVISKALGTFLDINTMTVDNWTFKLFYKWTVSLLVACSVIVASKQFFGGPISCDAGSASGSVNDEVLKSYCWMYSTFKIPATYKGPCSTSELSPNDLESPIYNSYYQWVSIYLFGIAILFFGPRGLWIMMEGGLMKHFCKGTATKYVEEYDEKIEKLLKYFTKNVQSRFRVYFVGFIFCQFLNLIVVLSVFGLTHIFLHHRFFGYGFNVWYYYQLPSEEQGRTNPMCYTFPRITTCEYYRYGSGGGQERISALCILALNIVNDKVFLVLWWWFVILILVSILEFICSIFQMYSTKCRYHLIRLRMHRYFSRNTNLMAVKEYIYQCGCGDWFVLYQMSKNLNRPFFMEFLVRLATCQNTARSIGAGLDDVDFGGGSIVDLMLQPNLEDNNCDRKRENCKDEEDND